MFSPLPKPLTESTLIHGEKAQAETRFPEWSVVGEKPGMRQSELPRTECFQGSGGKRSAPRRRFSEAARNLRPGMTASLHKNPSSQSGGIFQTVKKLGRAREGRSPFELSIVPSGMYGGHGAIFSPENPIFQRKNRFLAGSAPEKSLLFSGDW